MLRGDARFRCRTRSRLQFVPRVGCPLSNPGSSAKGLGPCGPYRAPSWRPYAPPCSWYSGTLGGLKAQNGSNETSLGVVSGTPFGAGYLPRLPTTPDGLIPATVLAAEVVTVVRISSGRPAQPLALRAWWIGLWNVTSWITTRWATT